jgi:CTP:molybdopterin cytidylyltransferase MocA
MMTMQLMGAFRIRCGETISFVGDVARTDIAARLARELTEDDRPIITMATTSDTGQTVVATPQSGCITHQATVPDDTTLLVPVVEIREGGTRDAWQVMPDVLSLLPAVWPASLRVVPFINAVQTPSVSAGVPALNPARQIADRLLLSTQVDSVVIGSVQRDVLVIEVWGRVAAVVLAAGAASRYGRLKQLVAWEGGTLLGHVVDTALASPARPVVVVLGNQAEACCVALEGRPVETVVNRRWTQGQSTSLRVGLAALPKNISATLILLGDQPRVTPATLAALIERYRTTLAPVIWPELAGRRGNPVLFDRALFPELLRLTGDIGGRPVLEAHAAEAERVPVSDPGILLDIDTPGDYQAHMQGFE